MLMWRREGRREREESLALMQATSWARKHRYVRMNRKENGNI